jgi:hypothetical protein
MKIAIQEIVQDKIFLDTSDEVRITGDLPDVASGPELDASP